MPGKGEEFFLQHESDPSTQLAVAGKPSTGQPPGNSAPGHIHVCSKPSLVPRFGSPLANAVRDVLFPKHFEHPRTRETSRCYAATGAPRHRAGNATCRKVAPTWPQGRSYAKKNTNSKIANDGQHKVRNAMPTPHVPQINAESPTRTR